MHEILRNSVCGECGHAGSHLGSLKIHIVSLFAASQGALHQHVEAVHEILRNSVCGDCGHAGLHWG